MSVVGFFSTPLLAFLPLGGKPLVLVCRTCGKCYESSKHWAAHEDKCTTRQAAPAAVKRTRPISGDLPDDMPKRSRLGGDVDVADARAGPETRLRARAKRV